MVDYDNVINDDGTVNWEATSNPTPKELDEIATLILRADVRKRPLGIKGDNPILFEEHLKNRHKREIYNRSGAPDPAFGQGIYNRQHPEGRKVNSDEQRKRNGASYYRTYSMHRLLPLNDYLIGRERLGLDEETTYRRHGWKAV